MRGVTTLIAAAFVLSITAGCVEEFSDPVPCGQAVRGASSDWTVRGELLGYSVVPGCSDTQVVVVGHGSRFAGDVEPTQPTSARGRAITELYEELLAPWRGHVDSWVAYTYSTTCEDEGMYGVVALYDWAEVDEVATIIGTAMAEADYGERIGIELRALECAELH